MVAACGSSVKCRKKYGTFWECKTIVRPLSLGAIRSVELLRRCRAALDELSLDEHGIDGPRLERLKWIEVVKIQLGNAEWI